MPRVRRGYLRARVRGVRVRACRASSSNPRGVREVRRRRGRHTGTESLAAGPIKVRVGLHSGAPLLTSEGYVGEDVHLAARIAAAGHGGQIVVSASTRALLDDSVEVVDLGEHRLKDFSSPIA